MTVETFLKAEYKASYKPELGDLVLHCNYAKNIVTLMLFIGYADHRNNFYKLQQEFEGYNHLDESMIYEAFEDFTFRPYYVSIGSCMANTKLSNEVKSGDEIEIKRLFLKPERDIAYLIDCYNEFKRGFFKTWQIDDAPNILARNNLSSEYSFLLKSDIAIKDLKMFNKKLLLTKSVPWNMYGKEEILEELRKSYKKRYMKLKAIGNSFVINIHKNVTATEFKRYGVYIRIDKNNKLYAYAYLGIDGNGEKYFMPLFSIDYYMEEVFMKKLIDMRVSRLWLKQAFKKGKPKVLKLSLIYTNCVLQEPSLESLTFDQRYEIKSKMAVLSE